MSSRTCRTDIHLLVDFLPLPTRIVRVGKLTLAVLWFTPKGVRAGPAWIHLGPLLYNDRITWSSGWNNALTQLTAKHGNEPKVILLGGSCPNRNVGQLDEQAGGEAVTGQRDQNGEKHTQE